MRMNMIKILVLLTITCNCLTYSTGSWESKIPTEEIKTFIVNALKSTTQGKNGELNAFYGQEIVYYAKQVISGLNHGVVFKNQDTGLHSCFLIWQKADKTMEIARRGMAQYLKSGICGIGGIIEISSPTS